MRRLVGIVGATLCVIATGWCGQASAAVTPLGWSDPINVNLGYGFESLSCPSATQCTGAGGEEEVTFNPQSLAAGTPVVAHDIGADWVVCPSVTQCTGLGASGTVVTFDPQAPGTPTPVAVDQSGQWYPDSLACPSVSQCTIVDPGGQAVTFDPQAPASPTKTVIDSNPLVEVACPSTVQCTATDNTGAELTFNPQAPGTPTPVPIDAYVVTCPAATQCTAPVASGGEVTFNPQAPGSPTPQLVNVGFGTTACPALDYCVTVSSEGQMEFDPTNPTGGPTQTLKYNPAQTGSGAVGALACPSVAQCVAADGAGAVYLGTPAGGSPPTHTITGASIRRALSKVLVPTGKHARLTAIVKSRGFSFRFTAPGAGRLQIRWYYLPRGALLSGAKKPKPILVASITKVLGSGGTARVKVKLTRAGHALLSHVRSERLTFQAVFASKGAKSITEQATRTLRH